MSQPSNSILKTVQPCTKQTDTHADHATCDICSNGVHLMHCMRAMWFKTSGQVKDTCYQCCANNISIAKKLALRT